MKVKTTIAKKQLIFLKRFIKNNILPKSCHLKPLIKSTKGYNIMKDCRKKLGLFSKNNAKQRMYSSSKKVKEIKQETLRVVTITIICFTLPHFENFNISGGLYITQLNIFDGAFIANIVNR